MAWVWRQGKAVTYLTIPGWEKMGVEIGFSTRWGGVSNPPYTSFNLGLHVGDSAEAVCTNRETWYQEWNADSSKIVIGEQVHGNAVYRVREADAGRGSLNMATAIPGVDALVTTSGLPLMAFFADCVPVFIYEPKLRAVGIAHAGWKGTAGKVVRNLIDYMQSIGGEAEECHAAIGPSIGPCCYEVDERVIFKFREAGFGRTVLQLTTSGHAVLDLWEANRSLLLEAGVKTQNITTAQICTACHTDSFFSHRKEGPNTGRMAGWIRLG